MELRKVFRFQSCGAEASSGLIGLRQRVRTVVDYSKDFRTTAIQCGWNSSALCDAFYHGLVDYIKDELVSYERPSSLDGIIELATHIDLRILNHREETLHPGPVCLCGKSVTLTPYSSAWGGGIQSPCSCVAPPSPLRKSSEEARLTSTCGEAGHFVFMCRVKAKAHQ